MLADAIVYGETTGRYDLLAWAIMPDHAHLVLVPIRPLAATMRWTANRANTISGVKNVPFWATRIL
jgi:REP element-mobilizing transposase RayT